MHLTDLEIVKSSKMRPIQEIASCLGGVAKRLCYMISLAEAGIVDIDMEGNISGLF
jgi:hypothetical protein